MMWPLDRHGRFMAPMPVEALRCPLCEATVKWSCPAADGATGHANCENGMRVSRRLDPKAAICEWAGTELYRHAGMVWVREPVSVARNGEVRR